MKKVILITILSIFATSLFAGINISKDDKFSPIDAIWMDMAVGVARDNVNEGGIPCGSVVVFNGALKSVGTATEKATSIETAIATSKLATLENAVIYTVNEPTSEAYNAICRAGADAVYFVNSKKDVIDAKVQSADAYDESKLDTTLRQVTVIKMDYPDATELLTTNK